MRETPDDNDEALVEAAIIAAVVLVLLYIFEIMTEFFDVLVSAGTTLVAAFWGAKYAFALQNRKELENEIRQKVLAGNKMIFNLINVHNHLCNYRDQFVNEFRNSPIRHIGILPAVGMSDFKALDVDSLAFVIESEERNVLMELSLFQSEAWATFAVIRERSEYHVSKIQQTLEDAGFGADDFAHIDEMHAILGPLKTTTIKKYTDQMIEATDEAIAQSERLINRLRAVLKEMLPGRVIVGMQKT